MNNHFYKEIEDTNVVKEIEVVNDIICKQLYFKIRYVKQFFIKLKIEEKE